MQRRDRPSSDSMPQQHGMKEGGGLDSLVPSPVYPARAAMEAELQQGQYKPQQDTTGNTKQHLSAANLAAHRRCLSNASPTRPASAQPHPANLHAAGSSNQTSAPASEHRPAFGRAHSHSHSTRLNSSSSTEDASSDLGSGSSSAYLSASSSGGGGCCGSSSASESVYHGSSSNLRGGTQESGPSSSSGSSAASSPALPLHLQPADAELTDAEEMVRGMSRSHIYSSPPADAFVKQSDNSTTPTTITALAVPLISHSTPLPSEADNTPTRAVSRKRRNSRLHASIAGGGLQHSNQPHQSHPHTIRSKSESCHSTSTSADYNCTDTIPPYTPGQNKRSHTQPPPAPLKEAECAAAAATHSNGSSQQDNSSVITNPASSHANPAPAASPSGGPRRAVNSMHGILTPSASRGSLVSVLACVLTQLFSNPLDTLPSDPAAISMFHTERIPGISIAKYLDRIAYYSECSEEALVMSFIHISRIYHANQAAAAIIAAGGTPPPGPKTFQLNTLSIHRLLLISIMCSAKFFDDLYFNNAFFSKVGGVSLREINALEVEFLAIIAFDLYIPAKIYRRFYRELTNAQLHPYCSCEFRKLPPLNFSEDLPASPAFDCDLEELQNAGCLGEAPGSTIAMTPLDSNSTATTTQGFEANNHGMTINTASTSHLHSSETKLADCA